MKTSSRECEYTPLPVFKAPRRSEWLLRVRFPLLEPSGDEIGVIVSQGPQPGVYVCELRWAPTTGFGLKPNPTKPSAADRELVRCLAKRVTLELDPEKPVYYATAEAKTLGYWAFEVGRTIATVASVIPPGRRRRSGRRLSTSVIGQLERELNNQGLRNRMRGPRRIRGITEFARRVDLSYRTERVPFRGQGSGDVYVTSNGS